MENSPVGLGTLLRRLIDLLDGDLAQRYEAIGLSGYKPRFTPLIRALLEAGEAVTISHLAARLGISQPAVSQAVREMVARDYVVLQPGTDARTRLVDLSEHMRAVLPRLEDQWAVTARAAAQLDRELPMPLRELISAAIERLEETPFKRRIEAAAYEKGEA